MSKIKPIILLNNVCDQCKDCKTIKLRTDSPIMIIAMIMGYLDNCLDMYSVDFKPTDKCKGFQPKEAK